MSDARPPPAEPDEHDAWLRQALRHAPDATAAPPYALREAILAEARSAVQPRRRSAAAPSLLDHVATFWSWLARPPVAAGFASVMAATLIGLMWWDRPIDEGIAPPLPPRVAKPDAAPQSPAAAAAIRAEAQSSSTQAPAPAAPATPPVRNAIADKRAVARAAPIEPTSGADGKEKERKLQAPLGTTPAAPAASPFPVDKSSENAAARRDQFVAPGPGKKAESTGAANAPSALKAETTESTAAATPTEMARRAEPASTDVKDGAAAGALAKAAPALAAPAPAPATVLAQRQRAAPALSDAIDALDARTPAAPRPFTPTPAPSRESSQNGASTTPSPQAAPASVRGITDKPSVRPMATLLASMGRDPQQWLRPAAGGGAAPLDAATHAWLADVETTADGHWQAASTRPSFLDSAIAVDTSALRLRRDGRVAAIVRVEDGGVFFELTPGSGWFAPLPAEAVARLRASLPPPAIGR